LISGQHESVAQVLTTRPWLGSNTDLPKITLVNIQNVSATKIVDSSSIQCAESEYGLRIQFLALVVMIHEVWPNA
jgi:hypothetical protein